MNAKKNHIVTYKKETKLSPRDAADLLSRPHEDIQDTEQLTTEKPSENHHLYHFEKTNQTVAQLSDQEIDQTRHLDLVDEVIEDHEIRLIDSPTTDSGLPDRPTSWNIEMIQADKVWPKSTGLGTKVGIIDTGIASHPNLSVTRGVCFVNGTSTWEDKNGHGTHCAGIVAGKENLQENSIGVAPDASLFAIKILNDIGTGMFSWLLAGLNKAIEWDLDAVSMSFHFPPRMVRAQQSTALQRLTQKLEDNGCMMSAASGNTGEDNGEVLQPARDTDVMAIGAVDWKKKLTTFSTWEPGDIVEMCAPGGWIISTWLGGSYKSLQGTSMACPHVAGAIALMKQLHPDLRPVELREKLKSSADSLPNANQTGAGLLNCLAAIS